MGIYDVTLHSLHGTVHRSQETRWQATRWRSHEVGSRRRRGPGSIVYVFPHVPVITPKHSKKSLFTVTLGLSTRF